MTITLYALILIRLTECMCGILCHMLYTLCVRCPAHVECTLSHIVRTLPCICCMYVCHTFYVRCIYLYKIDWYACETVRNRESVSCADCGVVIKEISDLELPPSVLCLWLRHFVLHISHVEWEKLLQYDCLWSSNSS